MAEQANLIVESNSSATRKERERSRNHPGVPLDRAIEFLAEIKSRMGGKPFSRNSLAAAFSVSAGSGGFSTKLAALYQFGLVEGRSEGLVITELGRRILVRLSDDDYAQALGQAFLSPDLYADLIKHFGGDTLPKELANRLYHEYDITESAKDNAARCFIESAKYARWLSDSGVLRSGTEPETGMVRVAGQTAEVGDAQFVDVPTRPSAPSAPAALSDYHGISLPVTGGKSVQINLPVGLTAKDLKIVKAQLDVIELQIKLDSELAEND